MLPYADPPQFDPLIPAKDKTSQEGLETPLLPHLPAFTVMPAHAHSTNPRALAQSTRYIATQSKVQKIKDTVQRNVQQVEDVDVVLTQDGFENRPNPEGEDLYAARILFGFSKDQHAIFAANDTGTIPVNTNNEIEADGTIEHPQKCPVTNCKYHRKGFPLKTERDEHVIQHFEGVIKCGFAYCWYNEIVDYGVHIFANVEQLRDHVHIWHSIDNKSTCPSCDSYFSKSEYLKHIENCIIHKVELEASERA